MTVMPSMPLTRASRLRIGDQDGRRDPGADGLQAIVGQPVVEGRERHAGHRAAEQQGRDVLGVGRHHAQALHAGLLDQGGHPARPVQQLRVGQAGGRGPTPTRSPMPSAAISSSIAMFNVSPPCLAGVAATHPRGSRGRLRAVDHCALERSDRQPGRAKRTAVAQADPHRSVSPARRSPAVAPGRQPGRHHPTVAHRRPPAPSHGAATATPGSTQLGMCTRAGAEPRFDFGLPPLLEWYTRCASRSWCWRTPDVGTGPPRLGLGDRRPRPLTAGPRARRRPGAVRPASARRGG